MSRYQKKTEEKRSDNSQKGVIHCLISSSTCHSLNKKLNRFIIVSFKIIKLEI